MWKFHDIYQTPFWDLLVPKNVIPVPDKWCYVYIFGSWLRANESNLLFDEKSFYVCITDIILIFNHLFLFIAISLFVSVLEINIEVMFYRILIVSLIFLFKSAFKNDLFVTFIIHFRSIAVWSGDTKKYYYYSCNIKLLLFYCYFSCIVKFL